jgi:histone chaperone ASF1
MAKVHILNVTVHNNPAPFFTPFQFEINFECLEELQDGIIKTSIINRYLLELYLYLCFFHKDLEFKIIYVGSAETVEFDQTLDQIVVDAVPKGQFKFMFQVNLTC